MNGLVVIGTLNIMLKLFEDEFRKIKYINFVYFFVFFYEMELDLALSVLKLLYS